MSFFHALLASSGESAPYSVYPSTDRALRYGSGSKDYESFGNFVFLSTGRMVIIYRKGSDHNAAGDGDICFRISDDGGVTLSAEVILSAAEANLNKTNPNFSKGDNDRVIASWTEIPIGVDLGDPTSVKSVYSDDLDSVSVAGVATATFSSEFTFGQTFSSITFEYIDGPGRAIRASDGSYLKPIWVTGIGAVQPQRVACYRSTDNCATFTYYSTVILDVDDPCDEACFILLPDDRIFCGLRCNSLHKFRFAISTTGGLTWGATTTTDINLYGKPAGTVAPNGTITIIGRDWFSVSNRTILIQSNNNAASFTSGYMDGRTGHYMYGDVDYHVTYGVTALWWMEAEGSTVNQGPTILIKKTLVESTVAVSPPTVYTPRYQSMRDFGVVDGDALPTGTLDTATNTLIAAWEADGDLILLDSALIFAKNNNTFGAFALRNVARAWLKATAVASPTYGVEGYDFNGTSQYIETNIQPNLQANYLRDSAEFGWETTENVDEVKIACGCGTGSFATLANASFIEPRTSNVMYAAINNNSSFNFANTDSRGFYRIRRTASDAVEVLRNGASVHTGTTVSTGRSSTIFVIGAKRYGASTNLFCTWNCRLWYIGGPLSANFETRWRTYLTAIGLTPNT